MKKIVFISGFALAAFTSVKAQSDNPCGAPALAVNTTCVYTVGSLTGATGTTGVPAPGCASYGSPDVWYTATVPASGSLHVTMDVASGGPTDMGMAFYTGPSCSSLTLNSCDDDGGPGLMPMITAGSLTPGSTVYIRVWKYGGGGTGPFQICAQAGTSTGCTSGGGNTSCPLADPFCSSTAYNYCNTTGMPSLGGGGMYGCLGSSPNPAFYYLHVATTGPITISINQYSSSGSPIDVDFVCWGPFSTEPAMCPGLSSSTIVSCSYSASASETCSIPSAVAGQWYMLLITNFSGVAGYVQFSQTGGTGSTDCSIVTPCSVTGTVTNPTCIVTTGSISAACTGTPPFTVNLVSGGTTVATMTGAGPSFNFTGLPAGTYILNMTTSTSPSSPTPCTNSDTVVITNPVPPVPVITVNSEVTGFGLCNGNANTVVSGGLAPLSYAWSNGVTTSGNTTLCAGSNCVTVTDANGCTGDTCVTITEPPLLTVTLSKTDPLCFGSCDGIITSNANGGVPPYTYLWSNGATTVNDSALCAGTYSLTVTDANGNTAGDTITLIDPAALVMPTAGVTNVSCHNACDGVITSPASGGSGTLIYSSSPALTVSGSTFSNVCAGMYTITVTDSNACFLSQTVTVTQPSSLSISMSSVNASCVFPNGSATTNVSGGTPPYTYLWSNGVTTAVNSGITSGTYSVVATDAHGCTISDTVIVGNNPPLVLTSAMNPTICNGETTTMTATATGGSGGPYTFTWVDENGTPVSGTTSGSSTSATVSPTDTTDYIITVDDGCVASVSSDTIRVYVNPLPQVTFSVSDAAGCSPFTTSVLVNTDIGTTFDYDFDCDGVVDLNSSQPTATTTYNLAGTYDVCVMATSQYGCSTRASMADLVTAYPLPIADFVATPNVVSILTPTIQFTQLSNGADWYKWYFGDSTLAAAASGNNAVAPYTSGFIEQPVHVYQDTGHYVVSLAIENTFGCKDSVAHPLIIEPDFEVFAPNAFTPNGDGRNDVFVPMGIGQSDDRYEFFVFDRWGQLIFKSTTPGVGWDGTHNSLKCASDVYVWKINVVDFKKIKHTFTGHVTLLR